MGYDWDYIGEQFNDINYKDWAEQHKNELLRSAADAIDPDKMGMTRHNALTLAGAMKNCGFSRDEFARVMSRSAVDKGTFANQWEKFTGEGQNGSAGAGTIFDYAKKSGWVWPRPDTFAGSTTSSSKKATEPAKKTDDFTIEVTGDYQIRCLFDNEEYKEKPSNPGRIRNREKSPTPEPAPITIVEFAHAVTSGKTFYPTVYNKETVKVDDNGKSKYEYRPIYQQVFVVDIDNEEIALDEEGKPIIENGKQKKKRIDNPLTIDSAIDICHGKGITPFFVYETFSSKYHRDDASEPYTKFRLCFALDEPLTVQDVGSRGINETIEYFISLFGVAADRTTTDPARMIYGTDERDRAAFYPYVIKKDKLFELMHVHPAVEISPPQQDDGIPDFEEFDSDYFNNTDICPPEPIIDQILYSGLGMLGAPAKMGKSYLLLQLTFCVAEGKPFLGFSIKRPGSVLYLDLQGSRARTKQRMKAMGYDKMPQGVTMVYKSRKTDSGLFVQINRWLKKTKDPVLIVVDMMEQVKGSQRKAEDAYRADNRILEPLHDISLYHDISIMVSMHTRKGNKILPDDDPFNEIIGSIGQFGSADCAWMIIGKRNNDIKRFSTICRDNVDGQQDYEVTFSNHRWSMTGTIEECAEKRAVEEYGRNPVVFTIKKLIQESGGGWYGTMSDLMREVLKRKEEYPVTTPEKMFHLVESLSFDLFTNDQISYEALSKNGGPGGRRYRFYQEREKQLGV